MAFMNEVSKIRDKVLPYLGTHVVDVGCSDCKIIPEAIGVDGRKLPGVDIVTDDVYHLSRIIPPESCTAIFSSHLLEHLVDDTAALTEWAKLIKPGGYLILYLPDADFYNNENNEEHARSYRFKDFMLYFRRVFCGDLKDFNGKKIKQIFIVEEAGLHTGEDKYSFYCIAKKI